MSLSGIAQKDTLLLSLDSINVNATPLRLSPIGSMSNKVNISPTDVSTYTNVADLLAATNNFYLKSYGMGSLAVSSVRGGTAAQTAVLWNDIPIQSPMLGLLDLSLLSVNAVNEVSFEKGGNTALWGSGAIGGTIQMNSTNDFNTKYKASATTTIGSFGKFQQVFSAQIGSQRLQSATKIDHLIAQNDFDYYVGEQLPRRKQTNAALQQQNFFQDFYLKANKHNTLSLHIWKQASKREIPPTSTQNSSEDKQDDTALRTTLKWKYNHNPILIQSNVAYILEGLDYFGVVSSSSKMQSLFGDVYVQKHLKKGHQISLGFTQYYTKIESNAYSLIRQEYKSGLFFSHRFNGRKLKSKFSIRETLLDSKLLPLTTSWGVDWLFWSDFALHLKISKDYRLPTFNDRYWERGGNPDLLAESGWSQEISISKKNKSNPIKHRATATIFHRLINNQILWSKKSGEDYWSAHNLTQLRSQGLELRWHLQYSKNKWSVQFNSGYDYIKSENQISLSNPKLEKGVQFWYVPVHSGFATAQVGYDLFSLQYQYQYTGLTHGFNQDVAAWQVSSLRLAFQKRIKNFTTLAFLKVDNLLDSNYIVVERRPMPGRYFTIGVHLSFEEQNN